MCISIQHFIQPQAHMCSLMMSTVCTVGILYDWTWLQYGYKDNDHLGRQIGVSGMNSMDCSIDINLLMIHLDQFTTSQHSLQTHSLTSLMQFFLLVKEFESLDSDEIQKWTVEKRYEDLFINYDEIEQNQLTDAILMSKN